MATLRFDGTDDYIGGVGQGSMNGALSVAVLFHRTAIDGARTLLSTYNGGSAGFEFLLSNGNRPVVYNDNAGNATKGDAVTQAITDTTDWWSAVFTRGSGETPRFHASNITDATAWTHVDGDLAQTTNPDSASGGAVDIGRFNLPGVGVFDYFPGDVALVGWWDTELTDGQVEGLSANLRTSDWAALSPASLTEFTSTSPTDLEGLVTWTLNGPTLTGANPDGWTFDGAGGPPEGDDVFVRVAGSWVPSERKVRVGGVWL